MKYATEQNILKIIKEAVQEEVQQISVLSYQLHLVAESWDFIFY